MASLQGVLQFYRDGFRSMVLGRTLWKIILIKLIVMFGVLKLFFFPDYLQTNFSNDRDRADHVLSVLSRPVSDRAGFGNTALAEQPNAPGAVKEKP
ncbi:MAG: DUF4492 domain-containing protein [Desulfobulbaceae bacterium]|nr:DUF4492 domain-containing protein [Desulfobulbaceae bacterium]